jgi:hypothetical protein
MGRAHVRGGRKAHNKRVAKRNENLKGLWQKQVNMAYEKHEIWKQEQAAKTQSEETKINVA